jgi:hypothetical protein
VRPDGTASQKNGHIHIPKFLTLNARAMKVGENNIFASGEEILEFLDRLPEVNFSFLHAFLILSLSHINVNFQTEENPGFSYEMAAR